MKFSPIKAMDILAALSPEDLAAFGVARKAAPRVQTLAQKFLHVQLTTLREMAALKDGGKPETDKEYFFGELRIKLRFARPDLSIPKESW